MTYTYDTNTILENLQHGVLVLSTDGFILYVNPAVEAITGFSGQSLPGQHISVLYGTERGDLKIAYELETARKTGHHHSEGWKFHKSGLPYWGVITFTWISKGPNAGSFTCLLSNTQAAKQAQLDMRQSEERYRLMVDTVRDYAIFMLDTEGNIMTWNEGARRTKGYSAYEIIGKHFSIFYTEKDLADKKPERELKIAAATGKYEEEGWRIKKDGSVFWANVIITALFNEQGKLIGFGKVTRDLTERRQNEEALRQSEERYRSLVEQVKDYGIFMLDEKGRIISWNEGAQRIKGYTAAEIIGKHFSVFYTEEDILNSKPAMELDHAIAEGKYEEEGWRVRKDGSKFWANVVITPMYNTANLLIGFSKVTRDLTERKEAEKALRESYQQYRDLSEALKVANSELSSANEELEQFTSIASHDLQEPVRSIKSFLQLIEAKLDNGNTEELHGYVAKAIASANRMKELIQNLLSYTQLGKREHSTQTVDMHLLVQQALQNIQSLADARGATIEVENEVGTIEASAVQIEQLLQNLLSNALKFTNGRAPQVKLHGTKQNGYVQFSISDNGIGIAPDDAGKVFEIFRRLNPGKTYPGTGIGLSICKKIVERHNGRIWLESQPGKGTTFYFTLNETKTPAEAI